MDILVCLSNPEVGNWQLLFSLAADLNQLPAVLWVPGTHTLLPQGQENSTSRNPKIPRTIF